MHSASQMRSLLIATFLFLITTGTIYSQELFMRYEYQLDLANTTEAPKIQEFPNVEYPESARKNGIEGTCQVSFMLAEDGTVKNIEIGQSLSSDVDVAIRSAVKQMRFTPANLRGIPVAVKMTYDFIVTANYDERDSSVKKPTITFQPEPVYPEKYRNDKLKDRVYVTMMFFADGTVKVVGVSSTMPKEFDRAAIESAEKIKFDPAVHKKSKKNVAQKMAIEVKFKP